MKNLLLLLLLFTGIVNGQIVTIPDANFKAFLLSSTEVNQIARNSTGEYIIIDSNADGEIQESEANSVAVLYIWNTTITNLSGLQYFTNLTGLDIFGLTNLTLPLEISNLTQLESMHIEATHLPSIDLTGLNSIKTVRVVGNSFLTSLITTDAEDTLLNLICYSNKLQSLDVSNFTHLTQLLADTNELTSLNVQGCTVLSRIDCFQNYLTNIDFSGLYNLQIARISNSPFYDEYITNINLSGCSSLNDLSFFSNPSLITLNLNGCSSLTGLNVISSNLTSLNVNGCSSLLNINVINNAFLSTLDLSTCINLNNVDISNSNLTLLFLKNGRNEAITFLNNPNLLFICADDSQLNTIQQQIISTLPNVVTNSYCTFFPGGNNNTISGQAPFDVLSNGCDLSDVSASYIKININDGTNSGATFTNNTGNYIFYTQAGDFTLTPQVENSSYFNFSPTSSILNFPIVDNSTQTQNFCMTANGVHPDLEVTFVPLNPLRPGVNVRYEVVFKNKGTEVLSGNVKLSYNSNFFDFISTFPDDNFTLNPNEFSWNYTLLQPFETRTIELTLHASLALSLGNVLNFTAIVNPIVVDEIPSDNTFVLHQTVVNSYDPNSISCLEGNTITTEEVGGYLHYNINFENIGTAEALNIVVKDTINTAKFDINSLQLQYASHEVETKVTGNIVEFIFKNINLPSAILNPIGGHGNVLFKIKTIPTLVVGDSVESTANIYFDYNAPIETNDVIISITALKNQDFVRDKTIVIAPNPTKNSVTITSKNNIQSIQLFDVQGRILQTVLENKKITTLDISNKSDGIYFLKVTTEIGSSVEKLVKEN